MTRAALALPAVDLMLGAHHRQQAALPPVWCHGEHAIALTPLQRMGQALALQGVRYDTWRARSILQLTHAANDEVPASPAQA